MSVNIEEIKPEILKKLEKQAKIFGLSIDEYLLAVLPKTEKELPLSSGDEFEADMIAFAEIDKNLSSYDGTYSREDIYFDHD